MNTLMFNPTEYGWNYVRDLYCKNKKFKNLRLYFISNVVQIEERRFMGIKDKNPKWFTIFHGQIENEQQYNMLMKMLGYEVE